MNKYGFEIAIEKIRHGEKIGATLNKETITISLHQGELYIEEKDDLLTNYFTFIQILDLEYFDIFQPAENDVVVVNGQIGVVTIVYADNTCDIFFGVDKTSIVNNNEVHSIHQYIGQSVY